MFQQRTTAVIAALLLLLVAPGLSSDESPMHQRRSLGFASSFSFTNLMYKIHVCHHPGPLCGPPKCGMGPHSPRLCNHYDCSSSSGKCTFKTDVADCDDSSCTATYDYYNQDGSSSSSGSSSSASSSSASSNSGGYDNDSGNGSSDRTNVSAGGSTNESHQYATAAFSPMPYVIGGILLVGVLAFIVMRKRNGTGNKELTEALGPHDEELDGGIVAQRLQGVECGVVQPGSLAKERNSTRFLPTVSYTEPTMITNSQPTIITTIPDGTEVAMV